MIGLNDRQLFWKANTCYELVIQLQVDICILDTILMLPKFGRLVPLVDKTPLPLRIYADKLLKGENQSTNWVPSLGRWQLLGSLSFVLQWRDVILNDAMDCKNNNNELTASGS